MTSSRPENDAVHAAWSAQEHALQAVRCGDAGDPRLRCLMQALAQEALPPPPPDLTASILQHVSARAAAPPLRRAGERGLVWLAAGFVAYLGALIVAWRAYADVIPAVDSTAAWPLLVVVAAAIGLARLRAVSARLMRMADGAAASAR